NHDQPRGKAAEALVSYVNGSRSHAVAMLVDRRVRPYNMKEGDAALYHASGTEQKVYLNDDGVYLLANNNKGEEKDAKEKERIASLRHVELRKQKHEIGENEQVQEHKHEGDKVNTEVRCIKDRIEFRAGDEVVGYYEKSSETWFLKGKIAQMEFSEKVEAKAPKVNVDVSDRFQTYGGGKTYLGLDSKDENVETKVVTDGGPAKKTL